MYVFQGFLLLWMIVPLITIHSCAAINGIDAAIVSRANEIATLAARGENLVAACAVLSTEESQTLQHAVCVLHKQIPRTVLTKNFRIRWREPSWESISRAMMDQSLTRKLPWLIYSRRQGDQKPERV